MMRSAYFPSGSKPIKRHSSWTCNKNEENKRTHTELVWCHCLATLWLLLSLVFLWCLYPDEKKKNHFTPDSVSFLRSATAFVKFCFVEQNAYSHKLITFRQKLIQAFEKKRRLQPKRKILCSFVCQCGRVLLLSYASAATVLQIPNAHEFEIQILRSTTQDSKVIKRTQKKIKSKII